MAHKPSGTRIGPNQVERDLGAEILEQFPTSLSRYVRNSEAAHDIVRAVLVNAWRAVIAVPMS